ncbi:MAG: DUF4192 domain-containing protein [Nocardioidaceae bacterium]|nr:DUF4192 domain-containing protein [Nocardioidaceae bacterium]
MTPTKTLRAKSPTDLLACVPTLLGFHPEHSVVMVTAGRAGAPVHARVDLPADARGRREILEIADELADVAARSRVSEVAVVVYTADLALATTVAAAMTEVLRDADVACLLVISTDGRCWRVHERDGSLRPGDQGTPYELANHPLTVAAVIEGRVVHASREALRASLAPVDEHSLDSVRRSADDRVGRMSSPGRRLPGSPDAVAARDHLVREGRWVRERVRRFLADRGMLRGEDIARLLVAIRSIDVRDVAWAEIRRESSHTHVDLWRDVVRRSPSELVAAPAALLAFAAWLAGDGALAWCAVDRCQEADPGYTLAALVTQALASATPPSVWSPFDPAELSLFAR